MRIKLSGGPAKNRVFEVPDSTYDYYVKVAEPLPWDRTAYMDPTHYITEKRGSYHKSNDTLKNGTVVFKWMGWIE